MTFVSRRKSKLRLLSYLTTLLLIIGLAGCGRGGASGRSETDSAVAAVPVRTEIVEYRDIAEFITVTGRLEGITDVTLLSETSGTILELNKSLGDWVEKDEEIGKLDNEVYRIRLEQAKATLSSAEAGYEAASIAYRSTDNLLKRGSVSQADYQNARFAYQNAKAQRDGASANLEAARRAFNNSQLLAPVSGYITHLPLKIGETLQPNAIIANIVDHRELIIRSGVSENHISSLMSRQRVIVNHNNRQYEGHLKGFGIRPLPNRSVYPIEIVLSNPDGSLLPGMVVEARIESKTNRDAIYTETTNLRKIFDSSYVFVAHPDSTVEMRSIIPGKVINEFTMISDGLEAGERIVIEGVENLEDKTRVSYR